MLVTVCGVSALACHRFGRTCLARESVRVVYVLYCVLVINGVEGIGWVGVECVYLECASKLPCLMFVSVTSELGK